MMLLAAWGLGTEFYDGWPPHRFMRDNVAHVHFVNPSKIDRACGEKPNPRYLLEGCQDGITIVLPNPCTYPRSDDYARLTCHELGHENGWPGNHPR